MIKILVAAGALSAFATPVTGAEAEWQAIDISRSVVSFVGDVSFIKGRDWRRRDKGIQERVKFASGEIFYEELYASGGMWQSIDRKKYLEDILAKGLNKKGPDYQPGEFIKRDFAKFSMLYLTPQSQSTKCFLGLAMEERDGRTWHMNVTACRALNSKTIAKFEDEIFDILNRVRFDGGELNRTRDALLPEQNGDKKIAKAEPKATAKAEPKATPKAEPKAEPKAAPKTEAKPAPKKAPTETAQASLANYPKLGPVASILEGSVINQPLKDVAAEYQTKTGAKALVMTENGQRMFWSVRTAGLETAIENAKNNCQIKTKLTCYVIATNDDLALNLDAIKNKTFKN